MTASSGRIRPFERADIPQVVSVHRQAWGNPPEIPQDVMAEYSAWLSAVFLDHPMRTEGHESIVFEDDGEVVGFFGASPAMFRSMERPIPRRSGRISSSIRTERGRESARNCFEKRFRGRRSFHSSTRRTTPPATCGSVPAASSHSRNASAGCCRFGP